MKSPHDPPPTDTATLDDVLTTLRERCRVDFRGYRRTMVERRVRNRMLSAHVRSYAAYRERLASDTREPDWLLDSLTIKVSRFFRDRAVFEALRARVLPELLRRRPGRPLRLWSAGCGRGEEAYSLAILLAEAAAPRGSLVHATDLDEGAVAAARRGRYPAAALGEVPAELAARYFVRVDGMGPRTFAVRAPVAARVRFAVHDLTTPAAPPARPFDLILCRNVLIYLTSALQRRVLGVLRDGLAPGGYLCLGTAEWVPPPLDDDFEVVERKAKIFRRRGGQEGVAPGGRDGA